MDSIFRHNYKEARGEKAPHGRLTSTAYHKATHILVSGFDDGVFFLHEMPDFNLIHSLRYNFFPTFSAYQISNTSTCVSDLNLVICGKNSVVK